MMNVRGSNRIAVRLVLALVVVLLSMPALATGAEVRPTSAVVPWRVADSAVGAASVPEETVIAQQASIEDMMRSASVVAPTQGSVEAADLVIPVSGGSYWLGDYLCIDGMATNTSQTSVGPIEVRFEVRVWATDEFVTQQTVYAAAHNLEPGGKASIQCVLHLPAYAGSDMYVRPDVTAYQPSRYPSAVDLTMVSRTVNASSDGTRLYTCVYRNDSVWPVRSPILGGWEFDPDGLFGSSLVGAASDAEIPSGGTVSIQTVGMNPAFTPTTVQTYCQALPVLPATHDPVYRFFNRRAGTHFYTASAEERDAVIARWPGLFTFEGVAYYTNTAINTEPLHRFFYKRGGTHFYTASAAERDLVIARWPQIFTYEGPAYAVSSSGVAGSVPVHRFVNRRNSTHFYTASSAEAEAVKARLSSTYIYEGVAFWVSP